MISAQQTYDSSMLISSRAESEHYTEIETDPITEERDFNRSDQAATSLTIVAVGIVAAPGFFAGSGSALLNSEWKTTWLKISSRLFVRSQNVCFDVQENITTGLEYSAILNVEVSPSLSQIALLLAGFFWLLEKRSFCQW